MSYSCLRSNADEAYHAHCKHNCCSDDACEERTGRWRGQTHYPNGQSISFTLSGIYTQDDVDFCKKFGIPVPPRVVKQFGAPVPPRVVVPGQGSARPSGRPWRNLSRAAAICLPPLAIAAWWFR